MATPEFILDLRRHIGHAPLWLSGVTAVVLRERDGAKQILLVRRADTGIWTPVTGIIDPGEQPAHAAAREVVEETSVQAEPTRLARVSVTDEMVYPNGDRCRYLDLTFRFTWIAGEPHPADGENTEARWFAIDDMPEMSDRMIERITAALPEWGEAEFQ